MKLADSGRSASPQEGRILRTSAGLALSQGDARFRHPTPDCGPMEAQTQTSFMRPDAIHPSPEAAAFFDIDGTLLGPPLLERRFLRYLRWRRELSPRLHGSHTPSSPPIKPTPTR